MSALFPSRAPPHMSTRIGGIRKTASKLSEEGPDRLARERRRLVHAVELAPADRVAGGAALVVYAAGGGACHGRVRATVDRAEHVARRPAHRDRNRRIAGPVRPPVRELVRARAGPHDLAR